MSTLLLKLACSITGEKYQIVSRETIKSQQKVTMYGTVILLIMTLWFINGFLLSHLILNYSTLISIVVSFICMFMVFVVETSIIKMPKLTGVIKFVRLFLALLIAIIGSFSVDEVLFKSDISVQLQKDNQKEALSTPNINLLNEKINSDNNTIHKIENKVTDLTNRMVLESRTGVGPKTNFLQRQKDLLLDQIKGIENDITSIEAKIDLEKKSISKNIETGIIKNLMALIHYNHENPIGWIIWGVFFFLFLIIEALCLIIKGSNDITSYESKKNQQDYLYGLQFSNMVESRKDPIREGLRLLHSKI